MDTLLDPSLDFDTQAQQIIQAQARIKALRATGAAPIEDPGQSTGWNSAVTGTHIGGQTLKTPTAALLNPLLANIGADYQQGRTNEAQTDLNQREQADYAKIITGLGDNPTASDFAKVQANPLARTISGLGVKDRLIDQPIRAEETKRALIKTVAEAQRAKEANDAKIRAAEINAGRPGAGGAWLDSNTVAGDGQKIFLQPGTGMRVKGDGTVVSPGRNQPATPVEGAAPAVAAAAGGVTAPNTAAGPNGVYVKPRELSPAAAKEVERLSGVADSWNALRESFKPEYSGTQQGALGGNETLPLGKLPAGVLNAAAGVVPGMDPKDTPTMQGAAQFWGQFREQIAAMRKEISGAQLTSSEKAYYSSIAPDTGSDPKIVQDYMDRMAKGAEVARARKQALDEPGAKWDAQAGVVRRFNGEMVDGTQSPVSGGGTRVAPQGKSLSTAPVRISSEAEWARLKPGDRYIDPEGNPRVRK